MGYWTSRRATRRANGWANGWARGWAWLAIAALVLLAGCGHASASPQASPHAATATPPVGPPTAPLDLTWQTASAPLQGVGAPETYAPAPSDGRVAYACGITPGGAQVWMTRNRGASWSRAVSLPYIGNVSDCELSVDAANPMQVAAWVNTAKMGASPQPANMRSFLSHDGGASWQPLPRVGPDGLSSLVSYSGALYAAGDGVSAAGVETRDVWVSRDGGRSWSALGATNLAPNPRIWINPQTGEMLGSNDYDLLPNLWRSEDAGKNWTRISIPNVVGASAGESPLVAPIGAGWRICVTGSTAAGPQATNKLACSSDLGQTWTRPPALNVPQQSPKGFTYTAPDDVLAIADDGALLACSSEMTADLSCARLAPGAGAWGALNAQAGAPSSVTGAGDAIAEPSYSSGPAGGMLWISTGVAAYPFITAAYP